jgi:hypothetical protein
VQSPWRGDGCGDHGDGDYSSGKPQTSAMATPRYRASVGAESNWFASNGPLAGFLTVRTQSRAGPRGPGGPGASIPDSCRDLCSHSSPAGLGC